MFVKQRTLPRLILCSFFLAVAFPSTHGLAAPPLGKQWELTFSDEFNAREIDTTKWKHFDGWGKKPWRDAYYAPSETYIENGNLVIRARRDGDRVTTGGLYTPGIFAQKYGYYEISARFDKLDTKGLWVAFWLYTFKGAYDGNPATGAEIDILEYVNMDDSYHLGTHWGESTGTRVTQGDLRNGYHKIGLQWNADSYTYFFDDAPVWTFKGKVSQAPLFLMLTAEAESGLWDQRYQLGKSAKQTPDYWYIDYVRVYKVASE